VSGHSLTTRERNWLGDQGQAQIERKHDALVAENQQLRDALIAMQELASVSYTGDPWYAENENVDAGRAFDLARAALAGTPSKDI
jgi:hypothetical protein